MMTLLQLSDAETATLTAGGSVAVTLKGTAHLIVIAPPAPLAFDIVVFDSGQMGWAGDWDFACTTDYKDMSGAADDGLMDIKVSLTGAWGGWLPYVKNGSLSLAGMQTLHLSVKPTRANWQGHVYFEQAGDTPEGVTVNLSDYAPGKAFPVNVWTALTIPVADFKLTNLNILKFAVQDQTGSPSDVFYLNHVGFKR